MSEKEHRLDVCHDCSVRERDYSEKKVYQCQYCGEWFCERHLEPRLGITKNFEHDILANVEHEWRREVEKDWVKKDGHPDWNYTLKKFDEIKNISENNRKKLIDALDKIKKLPPKQYFPEKSVPLIASENTELRPSDKLPKTIAKKSIKRKVITVLLAAIILGVVLWNAPSIILLLQPSSNAGWYSDWGYMKSHIINSVAGAGINYNIQITTYYGSGTDSGSSVYLNSKSRTDFGDVRFTSSDKVTLLSYWMESYTASTSATFWVKIPDNLNSSSSTIYVYYGKSTATAISNGTNTFLAFADKNEYSGWSYTSAVSLSISGSDLKISHSANVNDQFFYKSGTYPYASGVLIKTVLKHSTATYGTNHNLASHIDVTNRLNYALGPAGTTTAEYLFKHTPAFASLSSYTKTSSDSSSYWDLVLAAKNGALQGKIWKDGTTEPASFETSSSDSSFSSGAVGLDLFNSVASDYVLIRYLYARKYVSPEPTQGSWGTQEGLQPSSTQSYFAFLTQYAAPIGLAVAITLGGIILYKRRKAGARTNGKSHRKYRRESSYHYERRRRKFIKSKIGVSIIWLTITSIVSIFAWLLPTSTASTIAYVFWVGNFIVGVYFAYRIGMFIDRRLSNSNAGLFARRIISGVMSGLGLFLAISFYFTFALTLMRAGIGYGMFANNIMVLGLGFSLGLMVMGSYLFFTYQRGSGIIVYRG